MYVNSRRNNTKSLFLLYSLSEGRGVYVIYFPVSRAVNAIVVNPVRNRELTSGLLEKNFREACQTIPNTSTVSLPAFKVIVLNYCNVQVLGMPLILSHMVILKAHVSNSIIA